MIDGEGVESLSLVTEKWRRRVIALGKVAGNNDTELHAILEALLLAFSLIVPLEIQQIVICTDSQTAIDGLSDARRNVFKNKKDATKDLLNRIISQEKHHVSIGVGVRLEWVKGHDKNVGNAFADKAAGYGSKQSATQVEGF